MANIKLRRLELIFVWDKRRADGKITYEGTASGFYPDTTRDSGDGLVEVRVEGALTVTQFNSLSSASIKAVAIAKLDAEGIGPNTTTDDTGT